MQIDGSEVGWRYSPRYKGLVSVLRTRLYSGKIQFLTFRVLMHLQSQNGTRQGGSGFLPSGCQTHLQHQQAYPPLHLRGH